MADITAGKGSLHLSVIDPEFQELLKTSPAPPGFSSMTDIVEQRNVIHSAVLPISNILQEAAQSRGVVIKNTTISVRDGSDIKVRIYSPPKPGPDGNPVYVAFHGGGYIMGGLESYDINCIAFAEELGIISVNVEYRLAPEHVFPTAVNDAFDALQWATNASKIGGNLALGFIVGGVSAGGSLSAVLSILARDTGLNPGLTGAHLSIPLAVASGAVPEKFKGEYLSYEQNRNAPILNAEDLGIVELTYKPDITSPLYSPLLDEGGLKHLPPTYLQICGLDPLRDEAIIYKQELEKNGIKTQLDTYPGLPHAFWGVWPTLELSKKYRKDCIKGVKWLLEAGVSK